MGAGQSWRGDLEAGFALIDLAKTYADDGAYGTAADRLEKAAAMFRLGAQKRVAWVEQAAAQPLQSPSDRSA